MHPPVTILETTLPEVERRLVQEAMEHTEGNVSKAARILRISRNSLRRRLESMHKV